jgi:hypothetical protein
VRVALSNIRHIVRCILQKGKVCKYITFLVLLFSDSLLGGGGKSLSPPHPGGSNPLSALEMTRLALFKMYNQQAAAAGGGGGPGLPPPSSVSPGFDVGRAVAEQHARAALAAAAAREKDKENQELASALAAAAESSHRRKDIDKDGVVDKPVILRDSSDISCSPPPIKRERRESTSTGAPAAAAAEERSRRKDARSPAGGGGANIRITNRGER